MIIKITKRQKKNCYIKFLNFGKIQLSKFLEKK